MLEVGEGKPFVNIAAAAAAVRDGDTVLIGPGLYQECAIWRANGLTIAGAGMDRTIIADRPCNGQALFVTKGAAITIRDLTLARAAVPARNGAGIRAEGDGLTLERVRIEDSENGILAAPHPTSRIVIRDSVFLRNGICTAYCAHGIYINEVALLRVERSRFLETREGHHIKSRARATEVIDSEIDDGAEGTASYAIDLPHGGVAVIAGNRIRKGPGTQNKDAAIMIGVDGGHHPAGAIRVRGNAFRNDAPHPTAFVENRTTTPVEMRDNRLLGAVQPLRTVAWKPPQ